ncbi:SH3 domain-containing protein [Azospirillum isscasi]|uniref:SH3 domain-containing protein n=1 Tax=Azospirillum isscasi TaxID=3053926 RepID=A0ABU0WPF8_9PROT|nr:SH3 domain-containing protein [Azospirillum isscasi]MDQ2105454.1 SH3 domain-containing protein [Azospirillum isscasi]
MAWSESDRPAGVAAAAEGPPAARFKGGYAKAPKEDRGCALPDHIAEERSAETRRPAIAVGTRVRVRAAANLRVAPFCDAKVKDVLEKGETVTVLAVFGSWYEVGRSGRSLGFVGASLLTGGKSR